MTESTQDAAGMDGIDLAQVPDFDLGSLRVRPARCEVQSDGASEGVQRRVMQVLVVLARARGSVVSQDDLVRRCWRGLSVSDDAIFRCISKLRKLAAGYGNEPFSIETIPGVGYRLTSSVPAEDDATAEAAVPPDRRFRPALWGAAGLAILVLVAAAIWFGEARAPAKHYPVRVAVQPFEALTNSADARSLAKRIPNEVVDALGDSQIEAVLGGEPSGNGPAPGLLITGILHDDGHDTSVDVRIEDGATRAALWSTEFKRDSRQASDLPSEVAARVTDMVNMVSFARSADPPLTDNAAISALLQTTDMIRDSREGTWAQQIQHALDLVARHPEFAFGHSVLAAAYANAAEKAPDRAEAMKNAARREANLTLKLDPKDAGAYVILSEVQSPYDYRAQEAILSRGIKFATHPKEPLGALYQYEGSLLGNVGRLREGLSYELVAQATDQWSPSKTAKLALVYANMGNLAAASNVLQKAIERWPNHPRVREIEMTIAAFYEQPAEAFAVFKRGDPTSDDDQDAIWRTFVQAKTGSFTTEVAVERIRQAADQGKIARETEIMMLAGLGQTNQAFDAANAVLDRQEPLQAWFLFTPVTHNLRQDPEFVPLASRMGLIRYWRETGKRPDVCSDPAQASECSPQLRAALKARV